MNATVFTGLGPIDRNVFTRLGERKRSVHSRLGPDIAPRHRHSSKRRSARGRFTLSENDHDQGRYWKSKKHRPNYEDDLSQPWLCEETDPFTARIQNFEVPKKTRMPTNVKTYDGTGDPEDHLKIFQATLPPESIDNYEMLQKAFLGNYSQQKKYIKDPVEIHYIKQREGESTEAFMERFKAESMHVSGAPECMRISGFMQGITNPDLIKKLNDNIPKSVDKMMNVTTAFLRGEVAAANQSKKKVSPDDECIHLSRQIEETVKSGQLSHLVKEIKKELGEESRQRPPRREKLPTKRRLQRSLWSNPGDV
ncbi:hypothetical protein Tco_0653532 [Tanacetum coccineum]|uniref:Reverse transcriptase domain-containing protein n=1 Tax=Tanacetum coccineum TaxID=301880 RepID=A0ABQ4X125_9ASTR